MEALRFVLNAREDFDAVRAALARDSPASDVQRAAWFYQLIRYSYASGLTSFGSQPHDIRSNFPLIEQAHRRLAKVVIENKDFEKLIRQYDRPVSFFYLDPPYHATEAVSYTHLFASGQQQEYTDAETFLQCIRDELPNHPVTGFRYETLTDDPAIRKQVDDILYDLYGEENPRPLEDYENTPQEGMTMGGMT